MLFRSFQKLDHATSLQQALAVGAANTQRYGAGVLDVEDVRRLLKSTSVVEVTGAV